MKHTIRIILALLIAGVMLAGMALADSPEGAAQDGRVTFLLQCNEGMNNNGGNVGNTLMVVTFDPEVGHVRLMIMTWDTFVDYPGYDVPQLIDQPYRMNGPEETVMVFNANFDQNIDRFLSVNYLNLANMIDSYGGVNVSITRAERNALNGMVASKRDRILNMAETGLIERILVDHLAQDYFLDDWGEDTHLNGLQAVGFGWLQYDSVYNCCLRELKVISNLFSSVSAKIASEVAFYTNATDEPDGSDGRVHINLDDMTQWDRDYLYELVSPIFEMSYNNITDDEIERISIALAKTAYLAARQGVNVFGNVEYTILPLEATNEYDRVAGRSGHLIDYEANTAAINEFLYGTRDE